MHQPPSLPHGEFEINDAPQDGFRAIYALIGPSLFYFVMVWVLCMRSSVNSLLAGNAPSRIDDVLALMGLIFVAVLIGTALRARTTPSWMICITTESITVRRPSGEMKLNWAALTRVEERAGMLALFAGRMRIMLPLYRMSEVQIASVRSHLNADLIQSQKRRFRKLIYYVLAGAAIGLLFIVGSMLAVSIR